MATRAPKRRADGEGTVFRIQTSYGRAWRAEATVGWTEEGARIVATGTGPTQAIALERREKNRIKKLVLAGKLPPTALKKDHLATKAQTLEVYLGKWVAGLNDQRVGEETQRAYRGFIANHIVPALGDKPLTMITAEDIRLLFYSTLPNKQVSKSNPAKRLSPGAIRNIWKPLFKALGQAEREGLITKNPMEAVERPRAEAPQVDLDLSAPAKLLRALDGSKDQTMWLMSFFLGVRMGELIGLTWDRVHLTAEVPHVEIRQQLARSLSTHGCAGPGARPTCGQRSAANCPQRVVGGGLYIKPITKTAAGKRKLPLPDALRIALIEQKERHDALKAEGTLQWEEHDEDDDDLGPVIVTMTWDPLPGLEDLVFTTDGGRPITSQEYTKRWNALCEKAGVTYQRGHLNRHITATLLAERGVRPEIAKLILGHQSERMAEFYTHLKTLKHAREPLESLTADLLPDSREALTEIEELLTT